MPSEEETDVNPFTDLITRLRSLFRREREDAETKAELRFHLEMETAKNCAPA